MSEENGKKLLPYLRENFPREGELIVTKCDVKYDSDSIVVEDVPVTFDRAVPVAVPLGPAEVQGFSEAEALVRRPGFRIGGRYWDADERHFFVFNERTQEWEKEVARFVQFISEMKREVDWHRHGDRGLVWSSGGRSWWQCPCGYRIFIDRGLVEAEMRDVQEVRVTG